MAVHCAEYALVSRREFLGSSLTAAAGLLLGPRIAALPGWMPRLALADPTVGPRGDTLVCLFLRGGADGLNIVVPHGDEDYYRLRPTLAVPRPDDASAAERVLDLDGFFGLHPTLAPLSEAYQGGELALIHATGSPDESRSHFEAMDLMERGAAPGDYTGWLARHLATLDTGNRSALRAISVGDMLPASLSGTQNATALQSIAEYHLQGRDDRAGEMQALLETLYNRQDDLLAATAQQTFAAIALLQQIDSAAYQPRGRAYPENDLGQALRLVAQLIRAEAGVEVACVDFGGWDTHVDQGSTGGALGRQLTVLGQCLAAFYEDLAPELDRVTLVVMSEFGRRAAENAGLGTDHGHGNMMMALGGGIRGGQVFADWPGLAPDRLAGPGDLAITIDYRDILGEILGHRLNNPRHDDVFPGYTVTPRGVAVPRAS